MGRKTYSNGFVYIIDDVEASSKRTAKYKLDAHRNACNAIREMFNESTDYEVSLRSATSSPTEKVYFSEWARQLANKGPNDFIIIYFHGNAGWNGPQYTWFVHCSVLQFF